MFRIISATLVYLLFCTPSFSNFKEIKKKAKINNPEIIFPVSKNPNRCMTKMYSNPMTNPVTPIPEVKAPKGYGLDNRFNRALQRFENFKRPCGGGSVEACENVKKIILEWAKACLLYTSDAADE